VLGVPATLHEFDGKPIEQVLVGGRIALRAEIVEDFRNAGPEEQLPKVIDVDAGGERVAAID
jgi:hypothetical protein